MKKVVILSVIACCLVQVILAGGQKKREKKVLVARPQQTIPLSNSYSGLQSLSEGEQEPMVSIPLIPAEPIPPYDPTESEYIVSEEILFTTLPCEERFRCILSSIERIEKDNKNLRGTIRLLALINEKNIKQIAVLTEEVEKVNKREQKSWEVLKKIVRLNESLKIPKIFRNKGPKWSRRFDIENNNPYENIS